MSAPISTSPLEFETLRKAAETFGFHREAELIAQKADDDQALFTLLITGQRGVGKSTIINQLLGRNIAMIDVPGSWLNIYRRPESGREFAEIFRRDSEQSRKMPVQQALALMRKGNQPATRSQNVISRIVWHINAPGLPEKVAIAELPDTEEVTDQETHLWQADGIIVVFRADQINEESLRQNIVWLSEQRTMPVASMGVVSYMDTIPRKRWIQVLQHARTQFGQYLDVVVPCSSETDELDVVLQDSNALLYREVRNRFFASASVLRQKNHEHFAQTMRSSLADQFEIYVDCVLKNRWAFQRFKKRVDERLDTLGNDLRTKYRKFINEQKNLSLARAAAIDSFQFDEPAEKPAKNPGITPAAFSQDIYAYIAETTQQLFENLAYEDLPDGSLSVSFSHLAQGAAGEAEAMPSISFKFPSLPQKTLDLLCSDLTGGDTLRDPAAMHIEAGMYGSDDLRAAAPVPMDRWVTATEWLPEIARRAEEELDRWLSQTRDQLRQNLTKSAEQTFRLVHGFLPSEAPMVLMPLEETYGFLHKTPVYVPTPHLPGERLSPALFLCRMQEPEFVDLWNRQLIQRCYEFVIPRLERQLRDDVENARSQLTDQWAGSRDSIYKRVEVVWKKYGRRLAMKSAVKWSIPWVSTLMRDRLTDPVQYVVRTRTNIRASFDYPVSLFLHHDSNEFLQPIDKPVDRPLTPDQFVVDLIQQKTRKAATEIWRNKNPILIKLPLRKIVRRRSAQALGVLFGLAIVWIMMFGTSNASMIALGILSVPYIGITGVLIKRLIDRMYESGTEVQAERVYSQIRGDVNKRLDELKRQISREIREDDLHDEVVYRLREKQTQEAELYLPYKELIKRLQSMQVRKNNQAVNAAG